MSDHCVGGGVSFRHGSLLAIFCTYKKFGGVVTMTELWKKGLFDNLNRHIQEMGGPWISQEADECKMKILVGLKVVSRAI